MVSGGGVDIDGHGRGHSSHSSRRSDVKFAVTLWGRRASGNGTDEAEGNCGSVSPAAAANVFGKLSRRGQNKPDRTSKREPASWVRVAVAEGVVSAASPTLVLRFSMEDGAYNTTDHERAALGPLPGRQWSHFVLGTAVLDDEHRKGKPHPLGDAVQVRNIVEGRV